MEGKNRRRFQQTQCMHFLQGRCRYGDRCFYSHQGYSQGLMIRHAESEFNKIVNSTPDWGYVSQPEKVHLDRTLIDCGLSKEGRRLCANTRISEEYLNIDRQIDIVFVSPMNRALETAQIMMKYNNLKVKKVMILPQLSQVLSKICDLGGCLKEKRQKYKNYDFAEMDRFLKEKRHIKNENHWQDALVDDEHYQLISHHEDHGHRYMKILENIFPTPLESSQRCFNRAMRALDRMKELVEANGSEKILVFSHNRILKYIDGRFSKGRGTNLQNCEIRKLIF